MEGKLRIHGIGLMKFIIVWLLNGMVWWYFRSYLNFAFGIVMILAVVFSVGALLYYRKRLSAEITFSKGCMEKGNKLSFLVNVTSDSVWLPFEGKVKYSVFNVFTGEREEFTRTICTTPRKETSLSYVIDLEHCGMIEGRIEQFVIFDLLHIVKYYSENRKNGQAISYPRYQKTDYEEIVDLVENFPKEDESKNTGNDYTLDCEVREYIEGDSLKNIHWKLTAKKDNLMIRERLATGKQRMNVILQFGESASDNSTLMDSLRWILEELILKEYPVQLYFWSGTERQMRSEFISESGAIEQIIYEILSMSSLEEKGNVLEQFEMEYKGAAYIVVKAGEKKGAYIC